MARPQQQRWWAAVKPRRQRRIAKQPEVYDVMQTAIALLGKQFAIDDDTEAGQPRLIATHDDCTIRLLLLGGWGVSAVVLQSERVIGTVQPGVLHAVVPEALRVAGYQ